MYTFEQLKEDVRKEAEALRIHATKEERGRLNTKQLDPENIHKCIYGLMTGNCNSERSAELIQQCTCRYVADSDLTSIRDEGFERIQNKVNGSTVEGFIENRTRGFYVTHYSAIEAYILLPEAQNASLISYLRGETDTLTI
jgi:hypothetical protein